jgi:eukaryotic-like serine/threonine-protein kinase
MSAEPPVLEPGTELAPGYAVLEHMSRGNSLDVYDAWSEERDCRCVAKLLRADKAGSERRVQRLLREGSLLEQLTHPHIVRAYELVSEPRPVLFLETLEGETVDHLVGTRERRLPIAEIAHLGQHLCSAMHYLHGRGYLHMDLKPSNVVAHGGLGKVIDLSLAQPPGASSAGVGTAQYMAPEQARGDEVGPATDVWGIGAVLYEVASGEVPFALSRVNGSKRYEQLERPVEPLESLRRMPRSFAQLVGSCLEPDPADRPGVDELSDALDPFAG